MATTRESIQTRPTPLSEAMRAVVIRPGGSRETEMIRSGFTRKLITRRVPFERFREAFEERDDDIKVLIEVSP